MNESELKKLWQTTNEKAEKSMEIIRINTQGIAQLKAYHFISTMKPIKLFAVLAGIIWVASGTIFLYRIYLNAFTEANIYFLLSATVQVGLTAIALLIYLWQLITIYLVDISDTIIKTQKKLASLKMSTLWVARVLFLQLPAWTTFWWNEVMFRDWNIVQWVIAGSVTFTFAFAAVWLFVAIRFENRDKKWFKLIFNGKEWTPLLKAMELLEQLDGYPADLRPGINTDK